MAIKTINKSNPSFARETGLGTIRDKKQIRCIWRTIKTSYLQSFPLWNDRFLSSDYTFLEMSVLPSEKGSLQDFRRRNVPQLKEFLRNRVLKKTGANRDQGRTCCVGFRRGAFPDFACKILGSCSLEYQRVAKIAKNPNSCYLNFKSCHLNFLIFLYKR